MHRTLALLACVLVLCSGAPTTLAVAPASAAADGNERLVVFEFLSSP